MLNILKLMGFYLYLYPFVDLVQGSFHESFHMPTNKKKLKKKLHNYSNELQVN